MNPVLLKPGSDRRSHVVVMGQSRRVRGRPSTSWTGAARLARAAYAAFDDLASRYEVVVAEGAGSPAEINLRAERLREHGAGPARLDPDRRRRGHRPGRRLRGDVRHRRAALARGPGADRRLRGEQVPRRRLPAGPRSAGAVVADRTALLRGAALAPGSVAGLRGRPRPRGQARPAGGLPQGGRRPVAADQQLHRRRRARPRARPRRGVRLRPPRTLRRRPGGAARDPRDDRRPRLDARTGAGHAPSSPTPPRASRCSGSAAAARCSAHDLRPRRRRG